MIVNSYIFNVRCLSTILSYAGFSGAINYLSSKSRLFSNFCFLAVILVPMTSLQLLSNLVSFIMPFDVLNKITLITFRQDGKSIKVF